jgi:hypothetical protein
LALQRRAIIGGDVAGVSYFQFEKKRWPNSVDELVPVYLPSVPIDPWGYGKQTFGYLLVKNGLPDGEDRPLVYSRCESKDGLFFRVDRPEYGFYYGDGSDLPNSKQKQGGQFRDVARWVPAAAVHSGATTKPLTDIR